MNKKEIWNQVLNEKLKDGYEFVEISDECFALLNNENIYLKLKQAYENIISSNVPPIILPSDIC